MNDLADLWVDADIVWAAPPALVQHEKHLELTHRALAVASASGHGCVMFDYRRAVLTHDVLARHAVWLVKADLGITIRAALLLRGATPDSDFWARLLWLSGVSAAVFTDAAVAVTWLQGHLKNDRRSSAVAGHGST